MKSSSSRRSIMCLFVFRHSPLKMNFLPLPFGRRKILANILLYAVYCRFLSVSHSKDQFLWEKAPGAIIRTRTPISRIWLLSPDIFCNPKSKVCQIKVRAVRFWLALNFHENTGGKPLKIYYGKLEEHACVWGTQHLLYFAAKKKEKSGKAIRTSRSLNSRGLLQHPPPKKNLQASGKREDGEKVNGSNFFIVPRHDTGNLLVPKRVKGFTWEEKRS